MTFLFFWKPRRFLQAIYRNYPGSVHDRFPLLIAGLTLHGEKARRDWQDVKLLDRFLPYCFGLLRVNNLFLMLNCFTDVKLLDIRLANIADHRSDSGLTATGKTNPGRKIQSTL